MWGYFSSFGASNLGERGIVDQVCGQCGGRQTLVQIQVGITRKSVPSSSHPQPRPSSSLLPTHPGGTGHHSMVSSQREASRSLASAIGSEAWGILSAPARHPGTRPSAGSVLLLRLAPVSRVPSALPRTSPPSGLSFPCY